MNPMRQIPVTTSHRFQCGKSSQMMVTTHPVSDTALPIPSVSNIRKNMTAKNLKQI
jgi:hypothetical protein